MSFISMVILFIAFTDYMIIDIYLTQCDDFDREHGDSMSEEEIKRAKDELLDNLLIK